MGSPESRTDSPLDVQFIPLTYDHNDSDTSARRLVETLHPEWQRSDGDIQFVRFTDGITNTLLKAIKKRPGRSEHEIDQEAVLLRAYGEGTDVLIDRERETKAHSLLASRHLAPPLLARFRNGLLYRFIEGEVCTSQDLQNPKIYVSVAQMLGQWHGSLPLSAISEEKDLVSGTNGTTTSRQAPYPNLWTVLQSWIDALPKGSQEELDRRNSLQQELVELSGKLQDTPGLGGKQYVFSHCDLLSGNVIVCRPKSKGAHCNKCATEVSVSFIDYEYATPAPAAFDIANHFAEWGGFECDYSVLPTKSQRREFLAHYVRSFLTAAGPDPSDQSVEQGLKQLCEQVDLFRGLPGFYWGIWAIIQAQISQIEFDYASYAEIRLAEYFNWKAELDGTRKQQGKEMPVREKRWAEE